MKCGDANPNGNIALFYKGGCKKELKLKDAYRCVGCGGYFHKDCILEHFRQEKDHDWGRKEERDKIKQNISLLRQWLNEDRITDLNKMVTNEQIETWILGN